MCHFLRKNRPMSNSALMVPGGESDDDLTNGDETFAERNYTVHVLSVFPLCIILIFDTKNLGFANMLCSGFNICSPTVFSLIS